MTKGKSYSYLLAVSGYILDIWRSSSTWHLRCVQQLHSEVILECRLQHLAQQGHTGTPVSLRGNKKDTLNEYFNDVVQ